MNNKNKPRAVSEFIEGHLEKTLPEEERKKFVPVCINANEKGFFIEGYIREKFKMKRQKQLKITSKTEISFPPPVKQ